jgi:C-terminal processing protease CtpA/Prc
MDKDTSAAQSGRELYHAIWSAVGENFYDIDRLESWGDWEHRFDNQIDSDETAIRFAVEAIASLEDPYTKLQLKPQSTSSAESSESGDVERDSQDAEETVYAVLTPANIAYLRIMDFLDKKVVEKVQEALTKVAACDGIIVDLLHNKGGNMDLAIECCELFLRRGVICTVETRRGAGFHKRTTLLKPETCIWSDLNPDGSEQNETYKRLTPIVAGKPIAFMLSPVTASAAELFVCAVVMNGFKGMCSTVGNSTLGKGIGQSGWIDILGKVNLRVSCCRWLAPSGDWLGDGTKPAGGIDPDVVVAGDRGPESLGAAATEVKKMVAALRQEVAGLKTGSS